ncbi:MAG: hypothetical protein IPO05_05740 [Flavobacteriales bacterium]|jgi:hypothetical protein|nr:hypothetical protein [Flavobacteriales bacterium]
MNNTPPLILRILVAGGTNRWARQAPAWPFNLELAGLKKGVLGAAFRGEL